MGDIHDIEAKLAAIRARDERKKALAKPEAQFLGMALRSRDKALNATDDAVIKRPLYEARTTVASCLGNRHATHAWTDRESWSRFSGWNDANRCGLGWPDARRAG